VGDPGDTTAAATTADLGSGDTIADAG